MAYKAEIGSLNPGDRFYFPNDHKKIVWKRTESRRKNQKGNQVFIYCEDAFENVEDFNSNREVFFLRPGQDPPMEEQKQEWDKAIKIKIINKPATLRKPLRETLSADFLNELNNLNNDMNHKESAIKVYQTSEYSSFRMINGNRNLDDKKIKRIIKEIESGNDMLQYYPIQVKEIGERLDILDGQNRFYINKKLNRPVYYIIVSEEKSMLDIAKVNSNVEKWKARDFVNCYVQLGNENYKILQNFLDQYPVSLTVALQMLSTGNPGKDSGPGLGFTEIFRNGSFQVKSFSEAEALVQECKRFAPFLYCLSRAFVIAIYRIKKANLISTDDLLAAYHKREEMLTEQANYKAYVNILEQIINVGKQKRIVII